LERQYLRPREVEPGPGHASHHYHEFGGLHLPAQEGLVMATYTSAQALLAG